MVWYVLEQRYVDAERRARERAGHLEYIRALAAQGRLVAAGPWQDDTGSLIVYDVPDEQAARDLHAEDPYTTGGVTEVVSLRAWKMVVGRGT
jgi:uncharacterized protein